MKNKRLLLVMLMVVLVSACFKDIDELESDNVAAELSLENGLQAYYTFNNEDGTDDSEYGRTGYFLFNDIVRFYDGQRGRCVRLDGLEDQRFNIPYNFFKGRSSWTVSFWAKRIDVGRMFGAVGNQNNYYTNSGEVPDFEAGQNGEMGIRFAQINEMSLQSIGYTLFDYNYIMGNDDWHNYVVALLGAKNHVATMRLYIDGVLASEKTAYYDQEAINANTSIMFGGKGASMWIDEIRIYNRTLSESDVKRLFNLEK